MTDRLISLNKPWSLSHFLEEMHLKQTKERIECSVSLSLSLWKVLSRSLETVEWEREVFVLFFQRHLIPRIWKPQKCSRLTHPLSYSLDRCATGWLPDTQKERNQANKKCLLGVCGHMKFQQDSVIICQEFVMVKDCVRQSKCLQSLHTINKQNPLSLNNVQRHSLNPWYTFRPHLHLELTSALSELTTSGHR